MGASDGGQSFQSKFNIQHYMYILDELRLNNNNRKWSIYIMKYSWQSCCHGSMLE